MSSADIAARDLAVFWHPCAQMRDYEAHAPVVVASAQGSRLRLDDGRELIDGISSWWCKSLGHRHPRLIAALRAQCEAFEHVIAADTVQPEMVRLCERLLAAANGHGPAAWGPSAAAGRQPGHFGKVFLADNGSTAVEVAIKMALQFQRQSGRGGRTLLASFQDGYHGETAGALSVSDCALYKEHYGSLLCPVLRLGPLPLRSGPQDPRWQDAAAEWPAIQAALDGEAGRLAAIVYEPLLQGAGGMRLYSPDLLRRLRAWADAHGVLLIADEIASGYGRLGRFLAGDEAGVKPDLAVLSKGLSGGCLPLSAVLCPDRVYEAFLGGHAERRAFLHSNTYTGNALGVAVANAVLDVYHDEGILARVADEGPRLRQGLEALAASRPGLRAVRGMGMMAAVDLRRADGGPLPAAARTGHRVYREALARGAFLRPLGDTMYLFPPLNCPRGDAERMTAILGEAIDAVSGSGS